MSKPLILWTADVVGWAYHNRVMRLSRALPQYDHRVLMGDAVPLPLQRALINQADIIVCQGIKVVQRIVDKKTPCCANINDAEGMKQRFENLVVRFDSMRIDHNGEYFDIWSAKAQESPASSG